MRVLAVTTIYPRPGHETIGTYNWQQFRALAARHEVSVVVPLPWSEALRDTWAGRRVPYHYRNADGIEVRHPIYYYPPKVLRHRYGEFYLASVRRAAAEAVREFRPDVVLGCFVHPDGWAAVRFAREFGLPVVVKSHGSAVLVTAEQGGLRRERVAEALRDADGVVAVSRDLADHILALGAEPDRVDVVYNGIDQQSFSPGDRDEARAKLGLLAESRIVLFVGNLLISKGGGVLIEACAKLAADREPFTCYMIGVGRDAGLFSRLISRHDLGGRVVLAGVVPNHELPDWYRASDVVALPSFSEGIPNVLREALACGRPFVATRVGGIPEIAEPSNSIMVSPGSVEELALALRSVLNGGLISGRLSSQRPSVLISWRESADNLQECLEKAIRRSTMGLP